MNEDVTETPQLLLHFTDPTCAGCHVMMDPLGLAMENYDAIGRWRDVDQGLFEELEMVFDADDILWSTEQVIDKVANDPDFVRCVVWQVYTYALGRAPLPSDEAVIDGLGKGSVISIRADGVTLSGLSIIHSGSSHD